MAASDTPTPAEDQDLTERIPVRTRPRLFELGSVAQASVPGAYAWFVTVVPTAWSRGAPWSAKLFAVIGVAHVIGAALLEPRWPKGARIASVWGLATTSVIVWALCPSALASTRFDTARGITGMIGWGLFAYASAAPAVMRSPISIVEDAAPLKPRGRVPWGGSIFITIGTVLATALQFIGWQTTSSPERAVLVRLVCLALGLGLIGASTSIALARHQVRTRTSPRQRMRVVIPWFLAIFLLAIVGVVYRLTH
ncbi:hypothetical protein [Pendulispora albinea]|uniref:Uncharacterized protein n=1 Tax=Pendulispora albinea TaxID=2741071 RepID=A0ABZ2LV34_9BACT